jgi:hypothetical protein
LACVENDLKELGDLSIIQMKFDEGTSLLAIAEANISRLEAKTKELKDEKYQQLEDIQSRMQSLASSDF